MDADDPKTSLIALIVELASSRGPADPVLSALTTGGETAADALAAVLDHAMDVLDQLSASSPRKSRRAMRDLLDSVEELSDCMDEDWCDGVSRCSAERLGALASQIVAVQGLVADQGASDCVLLVSSLVSSSSFFDSASMIRRSIRAGISSSRRNRTSRAFKLSPSSVGTKAITMSSTWSALKSSRIGAVGSAVLLGFVVRGVVFGFAGSTKTDLTRNASFKIYQI